MENKNETARLLDTILSIPGMNEAVKIDVKLSRKQILLLSNVIERGLNAKEKDQQGLADVIDREVTDELNAFAGECLKKAGLMEFNDKLKALSTVKP